MPESPGTVANVTTGKRAVNGGIYVAPLGTDLPTSASASLNSAFKNLGYISADGVTISTAKTTYEIKEWGGDVVDGGTTDESTTVKFKAIEALNIDLLKMIHGASNVTESSGAITIAVKAGQDTPMSYVIDTAVKGGRMKRIVLPNASLDALGDIVYKGGEAVGYDITLKTALGTTGTTRDEYISAAPGT